MSSLSPKCKLRVIRARTGSAVPFESAQVIFAGDGARRCTLPLHGARVYKDGRNTLGLDSSIVTVMQPPESIVGKHATMGRAARSVPRRPLS
jgi:hypothetical protein